ncbi:MAG: hypothetical protein IH951_07670 [Bacteroidetes bacterium]|nr:hypothetical protein [Bacteroidota bacterium]
MEPNEDISSLDPEEHGDLGDSVGCKHGRNEKPSNGLWPAKNFSAVREKNTAVDKLVFGITWMCDGGK